MIDSSNRTRTLRTTAIAVVAALGLSGCSAYDTGYGYGGVNVGYGSSYYDSGYGGSPYYGAGYGNGYNSGYGWYGDYYYPGNGVYVFSRAGQSYRWNGDQQRYWEGHRYTLRDREDVRDYRNFRRDGRQDRREFRTERRDDRQAFRNGTVTREQFRTDRDADRQAYRAERRDDRRAFRQDLRDGNPRGPDPRGQEVGGRRNEGLGGLNRVIERQGRRGGRGGERPQ